MTWIGSLGFFAFAESIWLWRGVLEVVDQVLIGDPPNRLHVLFDKSQILFLLLKLPNCKMVLNYPSEGARMNQGKRNFLLDLGTY